MILVDLRNFGGKGLLNSPPPPGTPLGVTEGPSRRIFFSVSSSHRDTEFTLLPELLFKFGWSSLVLPRLANAMGLDSRRFAYPTSFVVDRLIPGEAGIAQSVQ